MAAGIVQSVTRSLSKGIRLASAAARSTRSRPIVPPTLSVLPDSHVHEHPLTVELGERSLRLQGPQFGHTELSYIWLRDACTSATSIDPSTRQKLYRTTDIPANIRPTSCRISDDRGAIEIEWDQPLRGRTRRDRSRYDLSYLSRHLSAASLRAWHSDDAALPVLWNREILKRQNFWIPYDKLHQRGVLLGAVEQLLSYGIVFFQGVPTEQKGDQNCELQRLASMLGDIRRTWYGDKVWDVKSVANAQNIAYTNLDLGLHMDLLHYENPPRFQFLHYLHSHPSLKGGQSYFVDSYRAAADVRIADAEAYDTLSTLPVGFEYRNGGHWRHAERPTFEHDQLGALSAVNYSPPFQAPLPVQQAADVERLHKALALFSDRVESPELRYTIQLEPGDCVAFDNQRVLHARTGFTWDEEAVIQSGEAGRHLKGCYLEGDSLRDRLRVLRAEIADGAL